MRLHGHRQLLRVPGRHGFDQGREQRRTRQRGDLARHAVDAERMCQVGRELEREHGVVQRQMLADVGAGHGAFTQLEQAAVVVGQLQFARRTQHAVAVDAAQLARPDGEGLGALLRRRQFGTDQRQRREQAGACVGRPAHHLQRSAARVRAGIDLAHAQPVRVRMRHGFEDAADDHAAARRRHRTRLFDLQAGHGEQLGQFGRGQRRIAELAQPGFRKLHGMPYLNCDRKRRSPSKNRRRSLMP